MDKPLMGQKIAILVANGFDETDMTHAQRRLNTSGATLKIIAPENGLVNSWVGNAWGHHFPTDANVSTTLAADFDALYVCGGRRSIDKLKDNAHARRIVRGFFDAGKPMMLLGCAVELLAAAERAKDYVVTGDAASQTMLVEAGATWMSETPCVQGFVATATGNDPTNPVFDVMDNFFAQEPEAFQQAA
jgi:protease I